MPGQFGIGIEQVIDDAGQADGDVEQPAASEEFREDLQPVAIATAKARPANQR